MAVLSDAIYDYGHIVGKNQDFDDGAKWAASRIAQAIAAKLPPSYRIDFLEDCGIHE